MKTRKVISHQSALQARLRRCFYCKQFDMRGSVAYLRLANKMWPNLFSYFLKIINTNPESKLITEQQMEERLLAYENSSFDG